MTTWSSTRQRPFDLWLILQLWPHTPQAFLEASPQAGQVLLESDTTTLDHNTGELRALHFSNSAWVLLRPPEL